MEKIFKKIDEYPENDCWVVIYMADYIFPDLLIAEYHSEDKKYKFEDGEYYETFYPGDMPCYYAELGTLMRYIDENLI